jgi:hypothetical protein
MISNHRYQLGRGLNPRAASTRVSTTIATIATIAAIAAGAATEGHAQQPPLTCTAEVAQINQALQRARQPGLCPKCARRLARTLESLYATGVMPNFYTSADNANWDDPLRRPAMMSGRSLARMPDGADLLADIDSGFGPRGIYRLRYTQANRPVAVTTADHSVSIPVSLCTSGDAH